MDDDNAPVVDREMVDKGRRDEASPGVCSTSPIASRDDEERRSEELLAMVSFGLG
jgi:hypothetical protein